MPRLAEALFPAACAGGRRQLWAAAGIALVSVVAQLYRLPHGAALDTLWAEDGSIFLSRALNDGVLRAFAEPYAGYVSVLPGTVAGFVSLFPLRAAAALFSIVSAAIVGLVAAFVFVASRPQIPSPWWRLVLAASLPLLPLSGVEMVDTAANLHWFVMCGMFWALLWRTESGAGRTAQFLLCSVGAASDPLCALLLPIAAVRVVALPQARLQLPTAGLLAGLLVQAIAHSFVSSPAAHPTIAELGDLYATRVVLPFFVGNVGTFVVLSHYGAAAATGAAIVLLSLLAAWAWRLRSHGVLALVTAFAGTSLLFFVVPVELKWSAVGFLPANNLLLEIGYETRYMAVPLFCLYSLAGCALGGRWPRAGNAAPGRIARAVLLVAVLTIWAIDFQAWQNPRVVGPGWQAGVFAAQQACDRAPDLKAYSIPIAPGPPWTAQVSCGALRSS